MNARGCTVIGFLALLAGMASASEAPKPDSEGDRINYSIGYQIGTDLRRQRVDLNAALLLGGVRDALSGAEPPMTPQEMSATLFALKRRVFAQRQVEAQQAAKMNLAEAEAFLAENATNQNVIVRPSGLQYQVLAKGDGRTPTKEDAVTVHYRGTLIDGTEFDSSYRRGSPATFKLDGIVQGWIEALQLMKAGGKWRLFVPPQLAYRERGMGSQIPPNSALIFDLELLSVASRNP